MPASKAMKAMKKSAVMKAMKNNTKKAGKNVKKASSKCTSQLPCRALLKKVEDLGVKLEEETQMLIDKAKAAAQSRQREETFTLLGRVLARVAVALEADVCQAQAVADKVAREHQGSIAEQSCAELALKSAKQAVLESKTELKDASKAISAEIKGFAAADKQKRNAVTKVQMWNNRKRIVKEVEEKTFQPLKEATLHGPVAKNQIKHLCKVGQKIGFDEDLLSIAPAVLQKELERRQTFDRYVVQSLDVEFAKRIGALSTQQKEVEQLVDEHSNALEEKREALNGAKEKQELSAQKMTQAQAALDASKKEAAEAKKRHAVLESELKPAMKGLERARDRDSSFRQGPLAAYMKLLCEKDQNA